MQIRNVSTRKSIVAILVVGLACSHAPAEAVGDALQIKQGSQIGSGTAFRRGTDCLVLTAQHVVPNRMGEVRIQSASGASAAGKIVGYDERNDIAMIELSGADNPISCEDLWQDGSWMGTTRFKPGSKFHFVRQGGGGKETVVEMEWKGGTPDTLSVTPTDGVGVIATDSGSVIYFDDKPAGIVLKTNPVDKRVTVLRMDAIHRVVGSLFITSTDGLVSLEPVQYRGQPHPNWTSYVSTWFGEPGAPPLAGPGHPDAECRLQVEVLELEKSRISNPKVESARSDLNGGCQNSLIKHKEYRRLCVSSARSVIESHPHHLDIMSVQMRVIVSDKLGVAHQKLKSSRIEAQGEASRADAELQAIHETFADLAPDLLRSAGCMKGEATPKKSDKKPKFKMKLPGWLTPKD